MSVAEEMFGIRRPENGAGVQRPRPRTTDARPPRPEGVSREVYMLTGGVTPASLAPVLPAAALRLKPSQKRAWVRKRFANSARADGLQLEHWVRVGEPDADYPFARFNKPVRMVTYTDAEYAAVLEKLVPLGPTRPLEPVPQQPSSAAPPGSTDSAPQSGTARSGNVLGIPYTPESSVQSKIGPASTAEPTPAPPAIAAMTNSPHNIQASPSKASGNAGSQQTDGQQRRKEEQTVADVPEEPASDVMGDVGPASNERLTANSEKNSSPGSNSAMLTQKAVHFVPPQKLWTREETDTLFTLCSQFDLRFPVIHDRWPGNLPPRSVDELKDRYYSVAKAIIEHRTKVDKAALTKLPVALQKHAQAISMNPFDYEYECIRKNQLERQYKRSKEELREEEETVRNARRIEANQKRLKKERERLAKLLTPAGDILMTAPDGKRVVDAKVAAANVAATQPQKVFPHRKINSGAFARSSQIYTPVTQSSRLAKRVDHALEELRVGTRPTPTMYVVDNFDLLRLDILAYLELQRTVIRKEEEVHSLRVRLAKIKGEDAPPAPSGLVASSKRRKADEALEPTVPTPLFSS